MTRFHHAWLAGWLALHGCVSDHRLGDLPGEDAEAASSTTSEGESHSSTSAQTTGLEDPPPIDERLALCESYCEGGCLLGRSREHCLYDCSAEFSYADHPEAPGSCAEQWKTYLGCMTSNDCISASCDADWQVYADSGCYAECPPVPDPGDCFVEWGCRVGELQRTIACTQTSCICYTETVVSGSCSFAGYCDTGPHGLAEFAIDCCGFDDVPEYLP